MKSKLMFFVILLSIISNELSLAQKTGVFTNHSDIGNIKIAGTALYDSDRQVFTITGSGSAIGNQKDEFQFTYRKMTGDFILRANMKLEGEGGAPERKTGWMIRHSLEVNSPAALASVQGNGKTSLQFRLNPSVDMEEKILPVTKADVIQLERRGNSIIMSAARMGERFFE